MFKVSYDDLRYLLVIALVAFMIFPAHADVQTPSEFGVKIMPGKMMENTDGVIEVYSKTDGMTIDNLIATSSDPSIVQIVGIDQDVNHMISSVKIKALTAGDAKIALAAPGFSSNEFDLTVYANTNIPTKLVIKTTPSTYATNGPKSGYVGVETTNDAGIPTPVTSDMSVSLSTSDGNVAVPKDAKLVIKQGEYYATGQILVNKAGTANIFASSASMQSVSASIAVNNVSPQNTVQIYVFPKTINAYKAATTYAIVQLHDQSGNPILAKDDIPVIVHVTNASGVGHINTSGQNPLFQVDEQTMIKKGSYWSYVPIQVSAGTDGTFNVTASATGSLVSPPTNMTSVATNALLDIKSARLDSLPILATGQQELIGVVHLEDPSQNTLLARDNLKIEIDSSNPSVVSVPDVQMSRGSQAALVFAQVGDTADPVSLNVVTDDPQSVTQTISSIATSSDSLKAESLLPSVLTGTKIPIAYYVTKNNALGLPSDDMPLMVSPSDSIKTDTLSIQKDQSILVSDGVLLKDGTQSLSVTAPVFSSTFSISGVSSNPKSMVLDYPEKITSGIPNTFSIELLDGQQKPTYSNHDMTIKLVSSDPSIIKMPDSVQIHSGSYFTTFTVPASSAGTSEIALLADNVPLSKFNVNVISINPDISIQSADFGESGVPVSVEATATYQQTPLKGLKVDWNADGAQIQSMDSITDSNGKAKMTFVSNTAGKTHVIVSISGGLYNAATSSKDVTINAPLAASSDTSANTQQVNLSIFGINPIMLIVPVVAGVGILIFKKREMFEGITERLNLSEKIAEIKEKISKSEN